MLGAQQQTPGLGFTKEKSSYTNCVARALYDNVAEAPDELAFRRGDLLTVLEQNPNGLEGWWLCSLRGRQGIAPGNRLRLLPGVYDHTGLGYGSENNIAAAGLQSPASPQPLVTPPPAPNNNNNNRRRSWHLNPNKVVMPQRVGDVYLYDVPQGGVPKSAMHQDIELDCVVPLSTGFRSMRIPNYDVPPASLRSSPHRSSSYDTPPSPRLVKSACNSLDSSSLDAYDVPRPIHDYDTPPTDYDIPATPRLFSGDMKLGMNNDISHSKLITNSDNYVVPPSQLLKRQAPGGIPVSNRSSGISLMSTGSLSPANSQSSLNASLSLSSLGGPASNRSSLEHAPGDLYDIPPLELRPVLSEQKNILPSELYDVPMNNSLMNNAFMNNSLANSLYDTPPAPRATAASKGMDEIYDVPPQVTRDTSTPGPTADVVDGHRLSFSGPEAILPDCSGKELRIDLDAAMENLSNVHQDVASSISKLFGFISNTWRKREHMEARMYDIKATCHRLRRSLTEFLSFAQGALSNSTYAPDKTLSFKLNKMIQPLVDSELIVNRAVQSLDDKNWPVVQYEESSPDELDQLVACARGLVEDVRQVSSFIQGNSTLIFKRAPLLSDVVLRSTDKPPIAPKPQLHAKTDRLQERPLPPVPGLDSIVTTPSEGKEELDIPNDYDYVNLESRESAEKKQEELKASLPNELVPSFECLVKQSEVQVCDPVKSQLAPSEGQLLSFYNQQMATHLVFLNNAIDAFLQTVKNNQPPKVFISHSKFVVISVYKLVYIGDTVQRNTLNLAVKGAVAQNTNSLCSSLKALVANVKKAALHFPSVEAVQQMVDSVVDVSNLAMDLKNCLLQALHL